MVTNDDVDERLRSRPSGSKERERMCADLLALDKGFSNVRPRSPGGGPDQGRDIEAHFEGRSLAFGAVGFVNGAQDTPQHRRTVKKKFESDLKSALRHAPDLGVFAFFTNVALTPKDHTDLHDMARAIKQTLRVEIFARERIRLTLNTPKGFGLRFQYLDLAMSKEEQASFFSAHGEELQAMLSRGFTDMDAAMARLEFLADKPSPLNFLQIIVHLKEPCSPADLGEFRILAELRRRGTPCIEPQFTMATENTWMDVHPERRQGVRMYVGTRVHVIHNLKDPWRSTKVDEILLGCELYPNPFISTLAQLDQHEVSLWVSRPLFRRLERISIIANVYEVALLAASDMYFRECDDAPWWPDTERWPELGPNAKALQWVEITKSTHLPSPEYISDLPWLIDYYSYLPVRQTQ